MPAFASMPAAKNAYTASEQATITNDRIFALLDLSQNSYLIPDETALYFHGIDMTSFFNFDTIPKTMKKTMPGEEQGYFALSNIGLSFNAKISNMLSSHASVVYYKSNKGQGDLNSNTGIMLDDAYLTFADFKHSPFFIQAGQFYLPFGDYNRFSIEPSLVQVLSIARSSGIKVGFADWKGLTAGIYAVNGQLKKQTNQCVDARNYGVSIRYLYKDKKGFHAQINTDYIYNMLNVNALTQSDALKSGYYSKPIPGVAGKLTLGYKFITMFTRYVSALKKSSDLIKSYADPGTRKGPTHGAKPSAWDVGTVLKFSTWRKLSDIHFTYSHSYDTEGLIIFNTQPDIYPMSQRRYILGYTIHWNKNVYSTIEWGHNWLYQSVTACPSRQGDNATIRLGVKF